MGTAGNHCPLDIREGPGPPASKTQQGLRDPLAQWRPVFAAFHVLAHTVLRYEKAGV
jgi:hypothetical protein